MLDHIMFCSQRLRASLTSSTFAICLLTAIGCAALAFEPVIWLVMTWYMPGYEGFGLVAFVVVAALSTASAMSPLIRTPGEGGATRTMCLLGLTALIRLFAQILGINVLGALLLCVDVYALARLANLDLRRFAVSPFWLAVLFTFCLPIEPIVQRVVGFGLQHVSAEIACALLTPWYADLLCEGVRLQLNGVDVLVDLPCSGARLISLSGLIFAGLCALRAPSTPQAILGAAFCLAVALIANGCRISILATGIAHAERLPFAVMDPIPHAAIGLLMVCLVTGCLVLWWDRATRRNSRVASDTREVSREDVESPVGSHWSQAGSVRLIVAVVFCAFATTIGLWTARPLDAGEPLVAPELPVFVAGYRGQPDPLSEQEQRYFSAFGGGAARASYGPFGLLVVRSGSPLRHLHDPSVCLGGLGFDVALLGTNHSTNTTVYNAERTSGDGMERYLVHVSYVSDQGQVATSIAEVVWRWLNDTDTRWAMIQRVLPLSNTANPVPAELFDAAILRAFNLNQPSTGEVI